MSDCPLVRRCLRRRGTGGQRSPGIDLEADPGASLNTQIVRLPTYASRIEALADGTVDAVAGTFMVTPENEEAVTFLRPYYYSSSEWLRACYVGAHTLWPSTSHIWLARYMAQYSPPFLLDFRLGSGGMPLRVWPPMLHPVAQHTVVLSQPSS